LPSVGSPSGVRAGRAPACNSRRQLPRSIHAGRGRWRRTRRPAPAVTRRVAKARPAESSDRESHWLVNNGSGKNRPHARLFSGTDERRREGWRACSFERHESWSRRAAGTDSFVTPGVHRFTRLNAANDFGGRAKKQRAQTRLIAAAGRAHEPVRVSPLPRGSRARRNAGHVLGRGPRGRSPAAIPGRAAAPSSQTAWKLRRRVPASSLRAPGRAPGRSWGARISVGVVTRPHRGFDSRQGRARVLPRRCRAAHVRARPRITRENGTHRRVRSSASAAACARPRSTARRSRRRRKRGLGRGRTSMSAGKWGNANRG